MAAETCTVQTLKLQQLVIEEGAGRGWGVRVTTVALLSTAHFLESAASLTFCIRVVGCQCKTVNRIAKQYTHTARVNTNSVI